jgi:hypothetical protein
LIAAAQNGRSRRHRALHEGQEARRGYVCDPAQADAPYALSAHRLMLTEADGGEIAAGCLLHFVGARPFVRPPGNDIMRHGARAGSPVSWASAAGSMRVSTTPGFLLGMAVLAVT